MAFPPHLRSVISHAKDHPHLAKESLAELREILTDWKNHTPGLSGNDLIEFLAELASVRLEPLINQLETLKHFAPNEIETHPIIKVLESDLQKSIESGDYLYKQDMGIIFLDLKGFTAASSKVAAQSIIRYVLNPVWEKVQGVVTRYGGTTEKYIGDATMILVRPDSRFEDDVASRAIQMAVAIARKLDANPEVMKVKGRDGNEVSLSFRIGVAYGTVISGLIGTERFCELTEIGTPVNSASRAEGGNNELHTKVLFTQDAWEASKYNNLMLSVVQGGGDAGQAKLILSQDVGLARFMPKSTAKGLGRVNYWQGHLSEIQKASFDSYIKGYRVLLKGGRNDFRAGAAEHFMTCFVESIKGKHDLVAELGRKMADIEPNIRQRELINQATNRVVVLCKLATSWNKLEANQRNDYISKLIDNQTLLDTIEDEYAEKMLGEIGADFPPLLHLVEATRELKRDSSNRSKIIQKQNERSMN